MFSLQTLLVVLLVRLETFKFDWNFLTYTLLYFDKLPNNQRSSVTVKSGSTNLPEIPCKVAPERVKDGE